MLPWYCLPVTAELGSDFGFVLTRTVHLFAEAAECSKIQTDCLVGCSVATRRDLHFDVGLTAGLLANRIGLRPVFEETGRQIVPHSVAAGCSCPVIPILFRLGLLLGSQSHWFAGAVLSLC